MNIKKNIKQTKMIYLTKNYVSDKIKTFRYYTKHLKNMV